MIKIQTLRQLLKLQKLAVPRKATFLACPELGAVSRQWHFENMLVTTSVLRDCISEGNQRHRKACMIIWSATA
jgi:hypothetical protein